MLKKHTIFSKLGGIRTRLLTSLLLICIIPVLTLGFISYNKSFNILSNKLQMTSQQNLNLVNKSIDNYFNGIANTVNMLSNNIDFQQLEVHPEYYPFAMSVLKDVKDSNKDLTNVYFGQASKKMNIYPEQKFPDGYDPTSRPWYQKALSNKGEIVFSEPYKDAATGVLVISISKTVEFNGQVVGVVAVDIDLTTLSKQLSDIKVGQTGYVYIADNNGVIISHPDKSILGTTISSHINIWDQVKSKAKGFTKYKYNGQDKFSSFDTNPSTGWKLLSSMDENELKGDTNSILNVTLLFILVIAVVAVFVSSFVSRSITKHVYDLDRL
jgi:methyl-accepting chemotaxis protein